MHSWSHTPTHLWKPPGTLFFVTVIDLTLETVTFSLYSVTFDTFNRHDHQPRWRALSSRKKTLPIIIRICKCCTPVLGIDGWGTWSPERSQIKWSWSLVSCPFNIRISGGNRIDSDPTLEASWCTCITACDISSRVAWGNCCLHRPNNSVSLTCGSGKSNYQLQRWARWGPRAALKALGCHPFCLPSQNENWVVCRVIKCVC